MNIRLLAFLILLTVFRLIVIGQTELFPDEAQYHEWSQRLDWCYFSKGPGVALAIRAGTALFGHNEFGVRFLAPILALGTSLALFALARRIYDARVATWAVILANVTPAFNAAGLVMTIDPLSIFFWTAALYTLWRALEPRPVGKGENADLSPEKSWPAYLWWGASGLLIGAGFLCKWTNAVQLLSAFLLLLLTPRFLRQHWLGLLGMLLVFVPFLVPVALWNEPRGWPTTHHLLARGGLDGESNTLDLKSFFQFFGSHLVYSPLIFAGLLWVLWRSTRDSLRRWGRALATCWPAIKPGLRRHPFAVLICVLTALFFYFTGNFTEQPFFYKLAKLTLVVGAIAALYRVKEVANLHWRSRFLVAFALPLILFYAWLSLGHDAEVNWTAPAMVSLLILAAQLADRLWTTERRKLVGTAVGLGAVMSLVIVNTDMVRVLGIPWPLERDPTTRMRGWRKTAQIVQEFRTAYEKEIGRPVFLIGENYGVASELCFYLPEKRIEAPGHPAVYVEESPIATSQYHFWGRYDEFEERATPVLNPQEDTRELGVSRFAGRTALYITTRDEKRVPSVLQKTFDPHEVAHDYQPKDGKTAKAKKLSDWEVRDYQLKVDGETYRTIRIFKCYRYKPGRLLD